MLNRKFEALALSLFVFTLNGCNTYTSNEPEFKLIVDSWVRPGNNVSSAESILEGKSFDVTSHTGIKQYKNGQDYFYASLTEYYFPVCSIEWRIIMPINGSTITEVDAMIFLTCL